MVSSVTEEVLEVFLQTGAYLKGHFRLTSGLHSPEYLQCALVLQHPRHAETLGRMLGAALRQIAGDVDLVVSPAMGGLIIGHEVARHFGVRHIFMERDADRRMSLRRGFTCQPGERAVVVEDVITTGGSTLEVIDLLRGQGLHVLAAGSIIDRSGGAADVSVPRVALATMQVRSWQPDVCPLCAEGMPVVKPGSRPA